MKKGVCIFSVILLLAGTFSGCAGKSAAKTSSGGKAGDVSGTITFVSWGAAEASTQKAFADMISGFETKYPNIKVKSNAIPYNDICNQLLIMNAGGSAPDVSQIQDTMVAPLQKAGAFEPINKLLDKTTMDDFYPVTKQGLTYGSDVVVTPWSPSPVVLFYNKTLLNKAGFTSAPTTMDQLLSDATAISKLGKDTNGNTIYGIGIQSKALSGAGYFFLPYIWNRGGDLTDKNGVISINTPQVVQALGDYKTLFTNKVTPSGLEIKDLRNLFAQGDLGFLFDGDMGYPTYLSLSPKGTNFGSEIGVTAIPDSNGFFIQHTLGVFKQSKNQAAAALLVDYLSGPDGMQIYNNDGGFKTPARKSVAKLSYYSDPKNSVEQSFIQALAKCKPLPDQNSGFLQAMTDLASGIQQVCINNQNPTEVAKSLDSTLKKDYQGG